MIVEGEPCDLSPFSQDYLKERKMKTGKGQFPDSADWPRRLVPRIVDAAQQQSPKSILFCSVGLGLDLRHLTLWDSLISLL